MTIILQIEIKECNSGSHNCGEFASCVTALGNDICTCPLGYTGDGKNCTGPDKKHNEQQCFE